MARGSGGCMAGPILGLMGVVFFGVGIGVSFWIGLPKIQKAKASVDWPSVQGEVKSSRITESRDNDGTTYGHEVIYTYTVENEKLENDIVWFGGDVKTSSRGMARDTVKKYPAGKEVSVHFNPEDPQISVLEPGAFKSTYFLFLFGFIFSCAGFFMLLGAMWNLAKGAALLGMFFNKG